MKLKSKFSSALLKARLHLGYTQSEVAEAVSITVRWYQRIESGRKLPGTLTMLRLILFLNLNVEEFREEVGLVEPLPSVRREALLR
ncbi:MAG: helix-turn-helix transcriptional regulator [Clostridia bacterium]|nr:helix-turn-helix transcriptional regulator [Clostridia bacterium]